MTGEHKIPSQPEIVRLFGILLVNVRPTGEFLLRYVSYLGIALVLNRGTRRWSVENVNEEFALLLTALGDEWLKYYNDDYYEFMTENVVA